MAKELNALTDELLAKINGLPETSGTTERLVAIRTANLTINTSEDIVSFDPAQSIGNGLSVNIAGNVECSTDGFYHSNLVLFVNESSDPIHTGWIEIEPLVTRDIAGVSMIGGQMNIYPLSLFYTKIVNDSTMIIPPFNIDLLVGDEIRFKARATSGTSTLETKTDTNPNLGSVSQVAARLSMYKVGPVTP